MQFIKSSHPAQKIMQILNRFSTVEIKTPPIEKKKNQKNYTFMSVFIEAVQKPIKPENLPIKIPQRPSNMKNQQSNLVLVIFNYPH